MDKLNFRCIIDNFVCDITPFKSYIIKSDLDEGIALISFGESELSTIRQLFKENIREGYSTYLNRIQLEGSDGFLYILSQTSIEKKYKMPYSIMRAYKINHNYKKKENKGKEWIEENTEKYGDGLTKLYGGKISSYRYVDKENEICFPLRLCTSKEKNRPLFVLFHGAGALGHDNVKQLFDHIPLYKQLLREDCNILIPQAPFGSNRNETVIKNYAESVKKLIDGLPADFDKKRIYVAGTSFGGCCVWQIIYLFPEYFAAAVPVMGSFSLDSNFEKYDVGRLAATPVWAAHSSDDTNVRIDSDDYYTSELEKTGADIKYTRWDKYGHSMYKKFYKTEKWAEWCLSKKRE